MSACEVCDGSGFMQAAPLSCLPTNRWDKSYVGKSQGLHRRAVWAQAVTVPCWACVPRQASVLL